MANHLKLAFEPQSIQVAPDRLLPVKALPASTRSSVRYQRIRASVREVGIIEPLMVYPQEKVAGGYILLDGHVRLEIAKELELSKVTCLVAAVDESFTYNHKVNQLSPIQEHFMIEKAIKGGVSEERLAKALNLDMASIRLKRNMLEGVCPEAVALLKERRVSADALRLFKHVKPMRQIEMAEMMIAANNLTASYVRCMIAATPAVQLGDKGKAKETKGLSTDDVARMERELATVERDFKVIQSTYGDNTLNLTVAIAYLRSLLNNAAVVRYLSRHHGEILAEFQRIVETASLKESA